MLSQTEWEKLNDLTAAIYGIKSLTAMRTAFLQKLMNLIDFDFSDFNLGEVKGKKTPDLVDPVVVSKYSREFEDSFTSLYQHKYEAIDYVKWIFSGHESIVYRESDLVNDEVRKKSVFYAEYLQPFGLVNVAGISVISGGIFAGAVTIYRREEAGNFSEKDLYILKLLLPHLQNKLSLQQESQEKNRQSIRIMLSHHYKLTRREIEIIGFIYEGLSNREICSSLKIAETTVKKHLTNIFDKLQLTSRTQLIRFLILNDLDTLW